jgi:aryl-alcohol dehydrogenase-like predicted oxidoreductase
MSMSSLPTRTLGRTGFDVTVLGFGAMELRGEPKGRAVDEESVSTLLNSVLDAGINLVDTSIDYGLSEERIGRHISHRRDEYFLASKCGCAVDVDPSAAGGGWPHDFSAQNIRAGIEQSLRRLRTDRLDLLQVHMSPSAAQLEEHDTIATMLALQEEGKIRFLGMSGTLPDISDHIELGVFDVFQIPYSVLEPEHGPSIGEAAAAGSGTLIRGGAGKGAGGDQAEASRGAKLVPLWERAKLDELLDGMSPTEFILRYTITPPDVSTTIVGTLSPEHLLSNVAAVSKGPLDQATFDEATRRVADCSV